MLGNVSKPLSTEAVEVFPTFVDNTQIVAHEAYSLFDSDARMGYTRKQCTPENYNCTSYNSGPSFRQLGTCRGFSEELREHLEDFQLNGSRESIHARAVM